MKGQSHRFMCRLDAKLHVNPERKVRDGLDFAKVQSIYIMQCHFSNIVDLIFFCGQEWLVKIWNVQLLYFTQSLFCRHCCARFCHTSFLSTLLVSVFKRVYCSRVSVLFTWHLSAPRSWQKNRGISHCVRFVFVFTVYFCTLLPTVLFAVVEVNRTFV